MKPSDLFNDLQSKISEALRNSPARDIEKNVRSMMAQGFSKLDLVTREEFDVQSQVLARTRSRLSRTSVSASPTMAKAGRPFAKCVSTATGGASMPVSARLRNTARLISPMC